MSCATMCEVGVQKFCTMITCSKREGAKNLKSLRSTNSIKGVFTISANIAKDLHCRNCAGRNSSQFRPASYALACPLL